MMIVSLIIALTVFTGLFVNAGRKLFMWLGLAAAGVNPILYGILYGAVICTVLGLFVISRIPDNRLPGWIFFIGHYALGLILYLMMIVNAADLLLFLGAALRIIPPYRTMVPAIGIMVLALSLAVTVYGAVHGASVQKKHYEIQIGPAPGNTSAGKDTLKTVLISDLHLGYVIGPSHLEQVVDAVNAADPDLICISGDIFDGDTSSLSDPEALQRLFRQMHATYGVYACLGNHDAGTNYDRMLDFMEKAGITVLQDEAVIIDSRFVLAGRRDSSPIGGQGGRRKEVKWPAGSESLPVIVMDHQPANIREYERESALILCGHTHQGQMFPFNLVTRAAFDVDYGYYRASAHSPQVIVTSGAGTWGPPLRVGTDSEVVDILVSFQ